MFVELALLPILAIGVCIQMPFLIIAKMITGSPSHQIQRYPKQKRAPQKTIASLCRDVPQVMDWLDTVLQIDEQDRVVFYSSIGDIKSTSSSSGKLDLILVPDQQQLDSVRESLGNVPCVLLRF